MVFEAFTMVFETETIGSETKTLAFVFAAIFALIGTMVFELKKIFSIEKARVVGMEATVYVTHTTFTTTLALVVAASAMVLFAKTLVFKAFTTGFVIIGRGSANPNLVVFGVPARSHHC